MNRLKKFRPLSEKELEFYGSLNWEDNPPINGFYETMMSIAHRQMAEMEAERQAAEATKKEIITENGTIIEKTEGYFVPQPREAKAATTAPSSVICRPASFLEDIQHFHQNGSMVVDNGQVGFLSEVRKNGATFTPLPIKPEQEKRAMLYITSRRLISSSTTSRLRRMRLQPNCVNTSMTIMMSLWISMAISMRNRMSSSFSWMPMVVTLLP